MKKLTLIFIAIIYSFISFSPALFASANTLGYLRVITDDTALYKDQSLTNIACFLPYTYYVKVIDDLGETVHVECYGNDTPKIDGFISKSILFDDDLAVSNPYANVKIKTATNTEFYRDSSLKEVIQYIFPDRTLCFYGYLLSDNDDKIYYVSYNGALGYVKEENVLPFTIENHPNELTFISTPSDEVLPNTEQNTDDITDKNNDQYVLRVIIILAIILAGFIAVFTFKSPKKRKSQSVYYDDNEYR